MLIRRPEVGSSMPHLVLPAGGMEATRQWEDYRRRCLDQESPTDPQVRAEVNPESGELVLVDQMWPATTWSRNMAAAKQSSEPNLIWI